MGTKFEMVRGYLLEIGIEITQEHPEEELFIVRDEERGISGLIVDCEDDILVLEQPIFRINVIPEELPIRLLKMNRELVHGAFAMDESGTVVVFRDTLAIEQLDQSEVEASINALELGLAQHGGELLNLIRDNNETSHGAR